MVLIYFWIYKHNCIEDLGITLSQDYIVTRKGKTLHFAKKPESDPKIHKPFDSITALIGKNGTGKSSIIEAFIKTNQGDRSDIANAFLIVFVAGKFHLIGVNRDMKFSGIEITPIEYGRNKIPRPAIVYYSPVYSPQTTIPASNESKKIFNVSNNEFYKRSQNHARKNDLITQADFLSSVSHQDFNRKFLDFDKFMEIVQTPFSPLSISMRLNAQLSRMFSSMTKESKKEALQLLRFDRELYELASDFMLSAKEDEKLGTRLIRKIRSILDAVASYTQSSAISPRSYFRIRLLEKHITGISSEASGIFALFSLLNHEIVLKDRFPQNKIFEQLKNIFSEADIATQRFEKIVSDHKSGVHFPILIPPQKVDMGISLASKLAEELKGFSFKSGWRGMSSGQLAKLNLFSRLYQAITAAQESQSLVLILDEADIYLHPEWQRNFLKELVLFLNSFDRLPPRLSLLIASHSPILISDLYQDMVNILKRADREASSIEMPPESPLGANIHTMYTKEFCLDSTIGALVSKKVSEIHDRSENEAALDKDTFQFIGKLGDPLLKRGLLNLISKKLSQDELLAYHEAEAARLRAQK